MPPDPRKLAISEHQRWLGYLQPEGLVVSPLALVDSQVQLDTGSYAAVQERLIDALAADPTTGRPVISHFAFFARGFLGWQDELLSIYSVAAEIPDGLRISTGEHGEILQPDAAYRSFHPADPAKPWLVLVRQLETGTALDENPDGKKDHGWIATPHQKFERLLRETGVPIGILCNGHAIRLCYAPKGENSGSITFPVAFMTEIAGRTVASALDLLLSHRRLITVPEALRLPALLRKSRDYQAEVSTALSHQVLEALFELARGFQAADEKSGGSLLADAWQRNPQEIYGGLITTLLRLVFLLYAEDRGLMPSGDLYQRNYSVQGLFERLRADHERYPDTMDDRFAAWPQLLALFGAVHAGCRHRKMTLPARQGHLFDPARFPFLEGRENGRADRPWSAHLSPSGRDAHEEAIDSSSSNQKPEINNPQSSISSIHDPQSTIHDPETTLPRVSDGTLHRVLHLLLYLSGERLSYRTLDVEQIGSVYETIMGFAVEKAPGRMIALKPKKKHGAPVHLSLDSLLAAKPAEREKTLLEQADTKLPAAAAKALKSAATLDDLLAALDKRIDRGATPHPVPAGSIILQPTDERRRSGSHYTPRSFTEPIVRKTLEPILDRLGRHPLPQQILDLKIADIAVGSAAFLVETCRQLADELVSSWHFHKSLPVIPPDEDELLYARRLVAQRCLYGVDRNPMAVDLAKLSLWLATMARDHPFTFLDHAIKCGDSLVGLTNKQIAAFHWDLSAAKDRVFGQEKLEQQIAKVAAFRTEILQDPEDTEFAVLRKQAKLAEADSAARSLKTTGDLVIAAFFAGEKPKQRQQLRDEFLHRHLELQKGDAQQIPWQVNTLKELRGGEFPIRPFHWEIEFPEVFSRETPGFDGIVGNPPFLGGTMISTANGGSYFDFLKSAFESSGNRMDLVAYFFRQAWKVTNVHAAMGLIATNTIGQGDTREGGLAYLRKHGAWIYRATRRLPWPGEAAVMVSSLHISKQKNTAAPTLDNKPASVISAFLFPNEIDESPLKLEEHRGAQFQGSKIYGQGFLFANDDPACTAISKMESILVASPKSAPLIKAYFGGDEIVDDPHHGIQRYVIDFGEMEMPLAQAHSELWQIILEKVEPERKKAPAQVQEVPFWWHFSRRTEHYADIRRASFALVLTLHAKHLMFTRMPTKSVFSHAIGIIKLDPERSFPVLQSSIHEVWARFMGSSLEDRLRYTPTDCFETFPFPPDWEMNEALEEAGRAYYEFRAALMIRNDEGLTKTYNRFHDPEDPSPDIRQLRELHAAMDRAVLDAYGWTDIPTACQFLLDYEEEDPASSDDYAGASSEGSGTKKRQKKKPYRLRWPDEVRDEVLARLLALNAERAEQERLAGNTGKKSAKQPTTTPAGALKQTIMQRDKAPDELI